MGATVTARILEPGAIDTRATEIVARPAPALHRASIRSGGGDGSRGPHARVIPLRPAPASRRPPMVPEIVTLPSARWLVVPLGGPHDVLSWGIVGGGRTVGTHVVWREVGRGELGPEVDPAALLRRALADARLPDAV